MHFRARGAGREPRMTMPSASLTVSHMLGEMVWVCSQSPIYRNLKIGDIEWLLLPPMMLGQYRVFHKDAIPIGFALWASLSEEVEARINDALAKGKPVRLSPAEWKSGERLWVIELVCPAATAENKLAEQLMADMAQNVFKGKGFYFHHLPVGTGEKKENYN